MSADPRGRWFRVYARQVRQHPKFRDLNAAQLGAWLILRSEAELRDGACFADRADALAALKRRHTPRAAAMLDGLIALVLFDLQEDGSISVHDRADHDRQTFPSDGPEQVRERVSRHRDRKRNDHVTTRNDSETTPVRAHSGAGAVSESNSDSEGGPGGVEPADDPVLPEGWDGVDAVVAYHSTTGRYPSQPVIDWLNRMSDDHPEEAIARVLAEQYTAEPNLGTLLSRTDAALKLDAHRRAKADERARAKAKANAEAPHRQKEREATPEEREQAAFQRQAIRLGLQMGIPVPTDAEDVRKFVMKHGAAS